MISLTCNAIVLSVPIIVALRNLACKRVVWMNRGVALLIRLVVVLGMLICVIIGCYWIYGVPLVLITRIWYELLVSVVKGIKILIMTIQVNIIRAFHLSLNILLVLNWFRSECRTHVLEVEIGAICLDIVVVSSMFNDDFSVECLFLGSIVGNILI